MKTFSSFILYYYMVCIIPLIVGCNKDWLEAKGDKKTTTISSVTDLQALLDNTIVLNKNAVPYSMEISSDGHYITEATWNRYLGTINQNRYTWTNSIPYENVSDWLGPYYAILTCNVVLANVKKFDGDPRINSIKAQAYFFRAFSHLNVAAMFAPAYNPETAGKDLGIPLRLSDDINEPSTRSSVEATYNQIISDLKTSLSALPAASNILTQPTKTAAMAMLARTYLYMRDFSNARTYAEQCLAINSELLEYSEIPDESPAIGINKEVIFMALLTASRELTRDYQVDTTLFNMYDTNDRRKKVFFILGGQAIQFKGTYTINTSNYFAGIAVDEIMLIKAECLARENKVQEAMQILNKLVKTRFTKNENGSTMYVDQVATDSKDALTRIIAERKKQLILRNIRWVDLKRLSLDPDLAVTLTRNIGGNEYTLEPGSYKYVFPIPLDILRASSLQQSPGWQ